MGDMEQRMKTKYIDSTHGKMAYGYTTGSCSAAAAKAAVYRQLGKLTLAELAIDTPKGWQLTLPIIQQEELELKKLDVSWFQGEEIVTCAVKKNAGDDPDVTNGILVYASVSCKPCLLPNCNALQVIIEGGVGVGRVTVAGLNQPVGATAINQTPRDMITAEVTRVCEELEFRGIVRVLISIPEGVALAEKTMNGRLGITGGISILGTSGIVEPMSKQALLDTIQVELQVQKEKGVRQLVIAPGNMGMDFMKEAYHYDLNQAVKCSNFVGETIDMAVGLGFSGIVYVGNIGKAIKLAGGIMNTHSKDADARMEILASCSILAGAGIEEAKQILTSVTTEEALQYVQNAAWFADMLAILIKRMESYLQHRAGKDIRIGVLTFSSRLGELGANPYAREIFPKV